MNRSQYLDRVFYKNSQFMDEVPDGVVDLIVTSPPYFNIKDYSLDGYQIENHSAKNGSQIGDLQDYSEFIGELLKVWQECERILKPNGKLAGRSGSPVRVKALVAHACFNLFRTGWTLTTGRSVRADVLT